MTSSAVRTVSTRHGPMLVLGGDVYVSRSLLVYGEYCPMEARALEGMIQPGMTVIEVGANMGSHTVALARRCAPGLLYAFEPQPRVFQILCANLAMNDVANVRAYPDASGAAAGWAMLPQIDYGSVSNFGAVSLRAETSVPPAEYAVRVTPIDDLPLEACNLIKVDVEGWEAEVLAGAARTIARFRPLLYVENDRPDKQQALIDQIDALGYVQYWHAPPLYSPDNYNGVKHDIFGSVASCNMFCVPKEAGSDVQGLVRIDPANWTSPVGPAPDAGRAPV